MMIDLFEGTFATQETLRFLEEKGGIGLWAWDLKSGEMAWSPGLYALAGLEMAHTKPTYEGFYSLIHPEDRLPREEVERLVQAGLPIMREFRVVSRSGRVRWISNRAEVLLDANGQLSRVIGALFDITRQHDAVLAMRASEERYRALVEAAGFLVWTSRRDGSATLPEPFRNPDDQLDAAESENWLRVVHPDDRERAGAGWNAALAGQRPFSVECRLVSHAGGARWFQVRAAPVGAQDGSAREWVWTAADIDERRVNPLLNAASPAERQLTGAQIRAARGLLNWSVRDLSESSGVSPAIIRRLEETNFPPNSREDRITDIQRALEVSGVEFLFPSSGKPGVRLA